jgi:hypothetical protein
MCTEKRKLKIRTSLPGLSGNEKKKKTERERNASFFTLNDKSPLPVPATSWPLK